MEKGKLIISPKTKVGELLDNFPELELVLINMSPSFAKLKNPVLRKTVARVATLQQIAAVGGLSVDKLVNDLRNETGQSSVQSDSTQSEYISASQPEWFNQTKIIAVYDASNLINSGGSPMNEILAQTNKLNPGQIFELHTPFVPAPIIDMLKSKGFRIFCVQDKNIFKSYFIK